MTDEPDRIVRCSKDGSHVPPDGVVCPTSGGHDFVVELFASDTVRVTDDLLTKLKRRRGEGVKPYYEYEQRSRHWNHGRRRYEQRRIVIDREARTYVQEWCDINTAEITWRKEGSLDDPAMFGKSAHGGGDDA